jgi:hypothetical protein
MKRLILALTLGVGAWSGSALAAPAFFDHFDSENGAYQTTTVNRDGFGSLNSSDSSLDTMGARLDDVELNQISRVFEVPEAGFLLLLGGGMLYIARRVRRGRVRPN